MVYCSKQSEPGPVFLKRVRNKPCYELDPEDSKLGRRMCCSRCPAITRHAAGYTCPAAKAKERPCHSATLAMSNNLEVGVG